MAKAATRPVRGFVALVLVASGAILIAPTFTTFGAPLRVSSRVTAHATSARVPFESISAHMAYTPMPWVEDLDGSEALQQSHRKETMKVVDKVVEHISLVDQGLQDGMTTAQLIEYDQILNSGIQSLEDQIETVKADLTRDSMEVKSEAQLQWLEYMLQSVEDLQEHLQQVRDAKARVQKENRGFLENMVHAFAAAVGGHKAVSNSGYPAVGVSSFTGEPSKML